MFVKRKGVPFLFLFKQLFIIPAALSLFLSADFADYLVLLPPPVLCDVWYRCIFITNSSFLN